MMNESERSQLETAIIKLNESVAECTELEHKLSEVKGELDYYKSRVQKLTHVVKAMAEAIEWH